MQTADRQITITGKEEKRWLGSGGGEVKSA
jgi:hypothetical protein